MIHDRRQFLSRLAAFCAAAGLPTFALADDDEGQGTTSAPAPTLPVTGLSGRVAVVGGGMAGAAVAKFLRLWGGAGVQVTLVEREAAYNSNILSNLVLTNTVAMSSLVFDYARLSSAYGINVLRARRLPRTRWREGSRSPRPPAPAWSTMTGWSSPQASNSPTPRDSRRPTPRPAFRTRGRPDRRRRSCATRSAPCPQAALS